VSDLELLNLERIRYLAQRFPISGNFLAVVLHFLRHNSPRRAQRPGGAIIGFIDGEFEILAPGQVADVRPDPIEAFEIETDLVKIAPTT